MKAIFKPALNSLRPFRKNIGVVALLSAMIILLGTLLLFLNNFDRSATLLRVSRQEGVGAVIALKFDDLSENRSKIDVEELKNLLADDSVYYLQSAPQYDSNNFRLRLHQNYETSWPFAEVPSQEFLSMLDLMLIAGSFPNQPFEIMLTDYAADEYIKFQKKHNTNLTYQDIIGQSYIFANADSDLFACTVSGILKTGYQKNDYLIEHATSFRQYLLYQSFYVGADFYANAKGFIDKTGIERNVEPNAAIVLLSGNYFKDLALIKKINSADKHTAQFLGSNSKSYDANFCADTIIFCIILFIITAAVTVFVPQYTANFYLTAEKNIALNGSIKNIRIVQMIIILLVSGTVGAIGLGISAFLINLVYMQSVSYVGAVSITLPNVLILLAVGILLAYPYRRKIK